MLKLPPAGFAAQPLTTVSLEPPALVRVSPKNTGEPYFGRRGSNRFDDPRLPESGRFGTCYLGRSIVVAVAETVLHDEVAINGEFKVALDELTKRYVVSLIGSKLTLANCTGVALKRMGLDGSFSAASYDETRPWAIAIHDHPQNVDGFLYMSRHISSGRAVVLFDRAKGKLKATRYQPLLKHPEAKAALRALHVTPI